MAQWKRIAWRTVLAIGLLAGPALGEQFPFAGVITGDSVNIRAGAGQNYYAVTQLDEGALVRVHGNLYGWYEIEPPAGTFSYVAKRFVKRDGDGPGGVIREDRVRIRAPSPAGPDKSYRRQMLANEGDRVKVLGEEGDFYKIEPPAKARLFVDEQFVDEATEEQIAAAGGAPGRAGAAESASTEEASAGDEASSSGDQAKETASEASSEESADDGGSSEAEGEMQKPEQDSESADAAEGDDDSEASPEDASASNEQSGDQAEPAEKADAERGKSEDAPQAEKQMESPSSDSDGGEATASAADDGSSKQAEGEGGSTGGDAPDAKRRPSLPDPAEVALDELPVQPRNDRLTQLERQYLALSRRSLEEQPVGRLRMEYEKVLSEADLSRADRKLAEARVRTLETRQELKASLEDISTTQREMTEAEKRRRAEDAKKPPDYIAVGRLTTSTLYTGDDQPRLYRLVNPLTQRTAAYVRPGGPDGPDVRGMLGEYVGIEGETEYNSALKLHVIEPERIDELSASERPPRRGSAEAAGR